MIFLSSYDVMQMPTWRSQLFRNLHKFSTNSMRYLRSWKCFLKNWLFYFTNLSILCCVFPFTAVSVQSRMMTILFLRLSFSVRSTNSHAHIIVSSNLMIARAQIIRSQSQLEKYDQLFHFGFVGRGNQIKSTPINCLYKRTNILSISHF